MDKDGKRLIARYYNDDSFTLLHSKPALKTVKPITLFICFFIALMFFRHFKFKV